MSEIPRAQVVRGAVGDGTPAAGKPSAPRGLVLRLAPRKVPPGLRRRLLFGGAIPRFGWLFAAFGMVFVLLALPQLDLGVASRDGDATATLTAIEPTTSSENERTIYRVRYTFFDDGGVERTGESYTKSPPAELGAWPVAYRTSDPSESRLDGMRGRPFSPFGLLVLLFPLVGLVVVFSQLRVALRDLRLLRYGEVAMGKLVAKRETSTSYNDVPVIALTFEYQIGGKTYSAIVKTLTPEVLEDDEREAMLYDPHVPSRATTLDHLPGSPSITADGELVAPSGISIHLLIVPAVFILLVGATLIEMI